MVPALLTSLLLGTAVQRGDPGMPVIDMHIHAEHVADYGPTPQICADNHDLRWNGWDPKYEFDFGKLIDCRAGWLAAPASDEELLRSTIGEFERLGVEAAVTIGSPQDVATWRTASPERVLPAVSFFGDGYESDGRPKLRPLAELRRLVKEGKVAVFAEIGAQYRGLSPADPLLDPYFALAEELDVPVGIHMGEGPPGGRNVPGYEHYRVALGNPLLLEEVLARHPKLRLYVMHFGSPFVDDMIALMYSYPQVYVDVAQNDWGFPRAHFYSQLRRLVDAGFSGRIMFGSDQMVWPQAIGQAIATIRDAPFLDDAQKRAILHDNAARFLRLPATR
jgi:predicted TIM-barrel fold metal-dependent hydrolase